MNGSFKVGDKVRYINELNHLTEPEYYPAPGTVGKVSIFDEEGSSECLLVQWPEGSTSLDDCWRCDRKDIEPVEDGDA